MLFWLSLRRLGRVAGVAAAHACAHAASLLLARRPRLARRLGVRMLAGPERLRVMLEDLGGTFIKFGQMLALQPDILPLEYCNALFNLLDRIAPFESAQVERTFVEELGRAPSELFDSFDARPIATASIGQVHVAHLGGRKLAVKVQRPNVEADFVGDIRLMRASVRLIKSLRLRSLAWLVEPMGEFVDWTAGELDYRNEARYMKQLRRNARGNYHERVPEVLWAYTTRRLLVTEYLEGETVLAYLRAQESGDEIMLRRLGAAGFEADQVARNIINNFLGDVFQHGMFHADLHPANLMILPGNAVGYIDFGITGVISRYSRQNLIAMTLAYTRGDLDAMCASFFNVSSVGANSDIEGFRGGVKRSAGEWYEGEGRERRLRKNFTLVMLDMLRLSRSANVWPERDVIQYIRSAIAIDGLITRLAPSFDVGAHLERVCDGHLRWYARRSLFTYHTMLGWANSGRHMFRDGAFRAASFLSRVARGEAPAGGEVGGASAEADAPSRQRAAQLSAVVSVVTLVAVLAGEPAQLGINLFTAEMILIVSTAALLLKTIRRLA
jgi:ubiquinone biosynthesis protein